MRSVRIGLCGGLGQFRCELNSKPTSDLPIPTQQSTKMRVDQTRAWHDGSSKRSLPPPQFLRETSLKAIVWRGFGGFQGESNAETPFVRNALSLGGATPFTDTVVRSVGMTFPGCFACLVWSLTRQKPRIVHGSNYAGSGPGVSSLCAWVGRGLGHHRQSTMSAAATA